MEKEDIIGLAMLIIFIMVSLYVVSVEMRNSRSRDNIYYLNHAEEDKKKFDIDFSEPEDKLSVPPKNIKIYDKGDGEIRLQSPCGDKWMTFWQTGERTGSMDPIIDVNHTEIACPIDDYEIKIGDIVVFQRLSNSKMISHRVIDIINNSYHIKGDNSNQVEIVNKSSIKYYVIGVAY